MAERTTRIRLCGALEVELAGTSAVVEVVQDPSVVVVRPRPLSEAGVAHVVGDRLGAAAHPAFAMACRRTTGGTPLLLGQLLAALAADGGAPEAGAADVVAQVGPRALSHAVHVRIGRLGEPAVATARAVAVLGDGAELPAVAAVAELAEADAAAHVAALTGAEVLGDEPPLGFVHPLVRDAVLLRLAPGDRPLLHARAAAVLRDRGASDAAVAGQLLQAPGRGEAWAVVTLRRAADEALARGAAESAVALLRRALAEPPDDATAAFVLSRLGLAEEVVGDPEAVAHLRRAADALRPTATGSRTPMRPASTSRRCRRSRTAARSRGHGRPARGRAGGTEPDWGPADVPTGRPATPGTGGTGGTGGGGGAGGTTGPGGPDTGHHVITPERTRTTDGRRLAAEVPSTSRRAVLRRGLRLEVVTATAGWVTIAVRLGRRRIALVRGRRVQAGTSTVVVRLGEQGRARLRRAGSTPRLSVVVTLGDADITTSRRLGR